MRVKQLVALFSLWFFIVSWVAMGISFIIADDSLINLSVAFLFFMFSFWLFYIALSEENGKFLE